MSQLSFGAPKAPKKGLFLTLHKNEAEQRRQCNHPRHHLDQLSLRQNLEYISRAEFPMLGTDI
jgi:hypothetical protein